MGSAAVLAAVVQTPGLSHFFGCTPLGPVGWGIAATTAVTASLAGAAAPGLVDRLPDRITQRIDALLHPDRLAELTAWRPQWTMSG